jgi:hypothetical protein
MANADSTAPRSASEIERQLAALQHMTLAELQGRYAEVFGELTRNHHKHNLRRQIAWRLQALALGDLSERTHRRAAELARDADVRVRVPRDFVPTDTVAETVIVPIAPSSNPRLPSEGTVLVRPYKGRKIEVTILADGFEYNGQRFRSLSAVANAVTGTHCNGYRFFNIQETR